MKLLVASKETPLSIYNISKSRKLLATPSKETFRGPIESHLMSLKSCTFEIPSIYLFVKLIDNKKSKVEGR